jgi:hypothetical protein
LVFVNTFFEKRAEQLLDLAEMEAGLSSVLRDRLAQVRAWD